jgi:hypothetical protein
MSLSDRMTEDADWKDGINIFRSRVIEQLDGILDVLDILEREISKLKQKENTP